MSSGLKEGVINKSHLTKCPKVTTRETLMRAPEIIPWSTHGKDHCYHYYYCFFWYFFSGGGLRQFPTKTSGTAKTAKKIVDGSHGKNRANDFYYRGPTFVVKELSCTRYCSPKKIMHLRSHMTFSCLICSLTAWNVFLKGKTFSRLLEP